jgi:ribonuclease HI
VQPNINLNESRLGIKNLFEKKGHADNATNNRCDELATMAADSNDLLVDEGYDIDVDHLLL